MILLLRFITIVLIRWNRIRIVMNISRLSEPPTSIHINICNFNVSVLNLIHSFSLSFPLNLSLPPLSLSSLFFPHPFLL